MAIGDSMQVAIHLPRMIGFIPNLKGITEAVDVPPVYW
jgi:hypothetical protein